MRINFRAKTSPASAGQYCLALAARPSIAVTPLPDLVDLDQCIGVQANGLNEVASNFRSQRQQSAMTGNNEPDGRVAELVGIEGGVVSEVINLESSGVRVPDRRPRHGQQYHEDGSLTG